MLNRIISTKTKKTQKSWSAPFAMLVFILMVMVLVFFSEVIGLARKESNLTLRNIDPDLIDKVKFTGSRELKNQQYSSEKEKTVMLEKLSECSIQKKEEKLTQLRNILIEAANTNYLNNQSTEDFIDL